MSTIYIISGCNGAGKTTAAKTLIPATFQLDEFVNADAIAVGLSPFNPGSVAFQSGRLMLERIHELVAGKKDFGFETTLATRSYVSFIKECQAKGYRVHLIFFFLKDVELALKRIKVRVALGGHDIPENIVRRRYTRGLKNFKTLYRSLVDVWTIYDNSQATPRLVASGGKRLDNVVLIEEIWNRIIL